MNETTQQNRLFDNKKLPTGYGKAFIKLFRPMGISVLTYWHRKSLYAAPLTGNNQHPASVYFYFNL